MEFRESGLPQTKLVEEAFKFSRTNALGNFKEAFAGFKQKIDMMHDQQVTILELEFGNEEMTQEEFDAQKKELDDMHEQQLKMGPMLIKKELLSMFENRRVGLAREIALHSANPSPELVAAVLLIDCVRSPIDYRNISTQFGQGVADLVAEVVHIDAYPSERDTNIINATPDGKRAYLAMLVSSLRHILEQIERSAKTNPGQKVRFPPGQEEQVYADLKSVWGNDPKLDARFIDMFNRVSDAAFSPFKLEADGKGGVDLVKGLPKLPPKPPIGPQPPTNGSIGGDVF